ncbi:MBL fold metallo-hydrolase [uncultured Flavonifractor sp.]|uniref:MBL fold metallo-hydrolase n=1 Tax=uncultured Flavonifractor sp. TaxID=1193534 RepID=UPI0026057AF9|nr:MBL fold metallo-hydrolase [uncultured Flavonifractor sp.]
MIRSFLPVGQGAFYLESFKVFKEQPINIVYDCGSLSKEQILKAEIHNTFQKKENINAVFISHLHRDHINGLPYLLQYCNVKNIFLPLITEENRKWLLLKDLVESSSLSPVDTDFVRKFLQDPYLAISEITQTPPVIHYIYHPSQTQIDDSSFNNNIRYLRSSENVADYIFSSEYCDIKGVQKWEYIPYNFNNEENLKHLIDALNAQLGKTYSCGELSDMIKRDKTICTRVKEAYKKVPGEFNTNSMTLLSMTKDKRIRQYPFWRYHCPFCNCYTVPNGCIYTGDYNAKHTSSWEQFMDAYKEYKEYIGCIQVPHHGSCYSYNHDLSELDQRLYYVISAGKENQSRHPHGVVVKDILMAHKYPIIVTEQRSSMFYFIVQD